MGNSIAPLGVDKEMEKLKIRDAKKHNVTIRSGKKSSCI